MQREISFGPPPGYRGGDEYGNRLYEQYLSSHFGPASIRSEGRFISGSTAANNYGSFEGEFYGRDECKCNMCQAFWRQCSDPTLSFGNFNTNHPRDADGNYNPPLTLFGELVRWCPGKERRKIGDYILFRLKDDTVSDGIEGEAGVQQIAGDEEVYHRMV